MFKIVKNPKWSDPEHKRIVLEVQLENEDEFIKFVACHEDCTTHGVLLYNLAAGGTFGEIEDSDMEKIIDGRLPPPDGKKLLAGELVDMTIDEKYEAGQVDEYSYADYKLEEREKELSEILSKINTIENKARAAIDDEFSRQWKSEISGILQELSMIRSE